MRYLLQVGSDTNHGSLLENTTYTRPPRLRSFSQLFRHKPSLLIYTRSPRSIYRLQVVQAQTTADYCRITGTPWIKYGVEHIGKRLKKNYKKNSTYKILQFGSEMCWSDQTCSSLPNA